MNLSSLRYRDPHDVNYGYDYCYGYEYDDYTSEAEELKSLQEEEERAIACMDFLEPVDDYIASETMRMELSEAVGPISERVPAKIQDVFHGGTAEVWGHVETLMYNLEEPMLEELYV